MRVSIICPFYNEAAIIEASVRLMLKNLESFSEEWELIIVNDGSTDNSFDIACSLAKEYPDKLHVLSYDINRGRGYAMRFGVNHAKGDIVITTEIDSSWGNDIVRRIYEMFDKHSDADMIIASPHLDGGGYKNVPYKRVFLSKYGNQVIRASMSRDITMNTGMTRGYLREKFLALPLDEEEKEIHLEILNKAIAFDYRIYEIPAVIEWKDHKLSKQPGIKRKSSSNVKKLIKTHLLFSIGVAPFRYIFPASIALLFLAVIAFCISLYKLFTPSPSIFWLLTSFFLFLFALLFVGIGLLSQQNKAIMSELWRIRSQQNQLDPKK